MEQKLIKLFEDLSKENDKIIKIGQDVKPVCFIILEDYSIQIIMMLWKNSQEKEVLRERVMSHILNQKIKGYIIFIDTKLTILDKESDKRIVKDCVLRTLYTPKEMKREFVFYEKNKITGRQFMGNEMRKLGTDEFDLFGKHFDENNEEMRKMNESYQKFKLENPDKFEECK